ncbi:MAG: hypothetical protein HOJ00_03485 [Phycisphaerae bacterium]|nr:hypothetical protein [Phycisphaerae bacterium]
MICVCAQTVGVSEKLKGNGIVGADDLLLLMLLGNILCKQFGYTSF